MSALPEFPTPTTPPRRRARRLPPPYVQREPLGPWRERLSLRDGRSLLLRPIEPADAPALIEGFKVLTPEEVRARFQHPLNELTPEMARTLTELDPKRAFALVLAEPEDPGSALVGAVARVSLSPDRREAEFALIVGRPLAGQGLGRYLLQKLVEWCRRRGVETLYGDVSNDNTAMLRVAASLGFTREHRHGEAGYVRVTKLL
ncbi:MAG TPA: GNAT family N-acetyltransferase [Xanthomonadales bacterium]|nr:GNAT family N-acetyltransferase [Xanthomonadales bacterium]